MATPYFPQAIFSPDPSATVPRVFAAPPKYVQGPGTLAQAGRYLSLSGLSRVAVLASKRGHDAQAAEAPRVRIDEEALDENARVPREGPVQVQVGLDRELAAPQAHQHARIEPAYGSFDHVFGVDGLERSFIRQNH